jgi:hypothetical protein
VTSGLHQKNQPDKIIGQLSPGAFPDRDICDLWIVWDPTPGTKLSQNTLGGGFDGTLQKAPPTALTKGTIRKKRNNPILHRSTCLDSWTATRLSLSKPWRDVASRRFRRRGEVGRTKRLTREAKGGDSIQSHSAKRGSKWPVLLKSKTLPSVRLQSDRVHSWAGLIVPQNVPCVPQKCSTWNRVVSWRLRWLSADTLDKLERHHLSEFGGLQSPQTPEGTFRSRYTQVSFRNV